MHQSARSTTRSAWLVAAIAAVAAAGAALLPPLSQDPAYHRFADTGEVLGIAHGWNVLSNAPFLVAGLAGLAVCRRRDLPARSAWAVAFLGIALVSPGSAWYHHAPSNGALVWDRLPMTVGFMGLLAAVLAAPLGAGAARGMLLPAVATGLASVAWWRWTGDLRPYVWVQFTPLLIIATVVALDPRRPATRWLLAALVLYLAAKVFESADAAVFAATSGRVGGHALKHLAAAMACAFLTRVAQRSSAPDP
jgi:hypothetical protein